MGKGRVAYEKAWAWRIVFLALGAVAASGSAASAHSYRALSARQTTQAMEDAGKKVGRQYVRNCLYRFYTRGDPSKLRDCLELLFCRKRTPAQDARPRRLCRNWRARMAGG